jgi:two-component system, NarL family, sensor kinase
MAKGMEEFKTKKYFIILKLFFFMVLAPATYAQINIQKIIQRADTIQDQHKKASSLLFLAEYFMQDQPDTAIVFANQALKIATEIQDSTCICDAYKCLSVSYAGKLNCPQSEKLFFMGLPFATNAKDSAGFYANMGAVYTMCGNLQKAEKCNGIARKIYLRIDDKNNLARLMINMGVMLARNSNYYQASESYLEALAICDEVKDEEGIAVIYQNMGEVMALQNQYDKAVGYYNSALNLFEKQERFQQMAGTYLNLGQIYIEQKQWDVAKFYLNKSYVIDTTQKFKDLESLALKLLGVTYLQTNKLESAERLIAEALRIQQDLGLTNFTGETSAKLAEVYFKQGHNRKALNLLLSIEKTVLEFGDDNLMARILALKSSILATLKQYEKAYFSLKESNLIEDSIFNVEKTKSIMNLELAYQTEKKEKQIDELKYNDLLRKEQLKNKKVQVYLLVLGVILLLVLLGFMFFLWRKRQQNEIKIRKQRFLQGRFEAEERAKDEIARELHDDIGGQLIGIILQLQSAQKLSEAEIKLLQNVYQNVRRLLHSLDEPLFTDISLQQKVRNYLSELKGNVGFEIHFTDDLHMDWAKIAGQQELQRNIYRIVQELFTNTLKFARASEVEIQMMNEDHVFVLIYEDNGVGMLAEEVEKNLNFNTIRKRVDMFDGDFEISSKKNEGIFVRVSIPLQVNK